MAPDDQLYRRATGGAKSHSADILQVGAPGRLVGTICPLREGSGRCRRRLNLGPPDTRRRIVRLVPLLMAVLGPTHVRTRGCFSDIEMNDSSAHLGSRT